MFSSSGIVPYAPNTSKHKCLWFFSLTFLSYQNKPVMEHLRNGFFTKKYYSGEMIHVWSLKTSLRTFAVVKKTYVCRCFIDWFILFCVLCITKTPILFHQRYKGNVSDEKINMSAAESTGASLDSLSFGDLPSVWTHLMVFVVGMRTAAVMESGSHVCLDILVSDRPVVLNYQSDCLSTVFAWILISPNSVLTPSGECVGDGERKCVCVCVCVCVWVCVCSCVCCDAQ